MRFMILCVYKAGCSELESRLSACVYEYCLFLDVGNQLDIIFDGTIALGGCGEPKIVAIVELYLYAVIKA